MTQGKLEITNDNDQQKAKSSALQRTRMVTSLDDIQSMRFWKAVIAEFLGTMLLVLIACGSCIEIGENMESSIVQIALCFGLSVATIVWNIAHISGGHINPAVTAGMFAARKISLARACFYLLFQLVGAIVGAGILLGLTPPEYHGALGMTMVNPNIDVGKAVGVEFFITFVLVFTVFASCDGKRKDLKGSIPLAIGLSVTMCHLFAIQYTGSSMNTARSFGPAVVMGNWLNHWVYWVGPILGGVMAGLLYEHFFAANSSMKKTKACLLSSVYDDDKYQAYKMKIQYTGSSMNTARSLGPALVMGNWEHHWVYWVGPLLGGVTAGVLYENFFAANASMLKVKACLLASDYDEEKYEAHRMKIRVLEEVVEDVDNTDDSSSAIDESEISKNYQRINHVDNGRLTRV